MCDLLSFPSNYVVGGADLNAWSPGVGNTPDLITRERYSIPTVVLSRRSGPFLAGGGSEVRACCLAIFGIAGREAFTASYLNVTHFSKPATAHDWQTKLPTPMT